MIHSSHRAIEPRIRGTLAGHIAQELFTNSAHFPIAIIFFELLREGAREYITKPDLYALIIAATAQAFVIGRAHFANRARPLWGNLIAPTVYTLLEIAFEGVAFFTAPHHLAYWGFALLIEILQEIQLHLRDARRNALILIENLARTSILLLMYWLYEVLTHPEKAAPEFFWTDDSHVFLTLAVFFTGIVIGIANVLTHTYQTTLRETAEQLRVYSEWVFGRALLSAAVNDPNVLTLTPRERTVLFMDIRGFTRWSDQQSPENVVAMLNRYFETAEQVWSRVAARKVKLTADEVMIVFATPDQAATAALELRDAITTTLAPFALSAGIGIHTGLLAEGLIGSRTLKGYDVIGDTVNIAKRICDVARGGEILLSRATREALGARALIHETRAAPVKGKTESLAVFALQAITPVNLHPK
jgi:class 3 adenylate cyclase